MSKDRLGAANRSVLLSAALIGSGILLGCGNGREPVSTSVGPSGGTSTSLDQRAVLQIPAGAVADHLEVVVRPVADGLGLPAGAVPGTLFEVLPAGVKFVKPVTLTIKYDPGKLPAADHSWLRMASLGGGKLGATQLEAHDPRSSSLSAKIVATGQYLLVDLKIAKAVVATSQKPITEVDVLFVVDNSNSMQEEQVNLSQNFPRLLQKLEAAKLGYRLGVISSDLGASNFSFITCEVPGGDGGKLINQPGKLAPAGCPTPKDPWIEKGPSGSNVADPAAAFSCIAQLGTGGCGFEHQLESARRALSPGVNPGFLRSDAGLAVVFLTDEDDCSASKGELFDPSQQGLADPLGPLSSFRCFEFGITCDVNGRAPGPRQSCQPAPGWLHEVGDYASFFKSLKPAGRLLVATVAGPTGPVEVGLDGSNATLKPSCRSSNGSAAPAIRMKALMDALGETGRFNQGRNPDGSEVPVDICSNDFSPALSYIGDMVTSELLTSWCLPYRPADTNPLSPELDADCWVSGDQAGPIAACTAGSTAPCFVVESSAACSSSAALRIRNLQPTGLGAQAHITCLVL